MRAGINLAADAIESGCGCKSDTADESDADLVIPSRLEVQRQGWVRAVDDKYEVVDRDDRQEQRYNRHDESIVSEMVSERFEMAQCSRVVQMSMSLDLDLNGKASWKANRDGRRKRCVCKCVWLD